MEEHKSYLIRGMRLPVHAAGAGWYVAGSVLRRGRAGSVIEVARFELRGFEIGIEALAVWFGREIARLIVDEWATPAQKSRAAIRAMRGEALLFDSVSDHCIGRGDSETKRGVIGAWVCVLRIG